MSVYAHLHIFRSITMRHVASLSQESPHRGPIFDLSFLGTCLETFNVIVFPLCCQFLNWWLKLKLWDLIALQYCFTSKYLYRQRMQNNYLICTMNCCLPGAIRKCWSWFLSSIVAAPANFLTWDDDGNTRYLAFKRLFNISIFIVVL